MYVLIDMIIARQVVNQKKAKIPQDFIQKDTLKQTRHLVECAVTEPLYVSSSQIILIYALFLSSLEVADEWFFGH